MPMDTPDLLLGDVLDLEPLTLVLHAVVASVLDDLGQVDGRGGSLSSSTSTPRHAVERVEHPLQQGQDRLHS